MSAESTVVADFIPTEPSAVAYQSEADLERAFASPTTTSSPGSSKICRRPSPPPADARSFLEDAIQDYNELFGTSFDTSADRFQNYYRDLSLRLKNREIDLVIVVNMFLTGFDATTLNTLWVDKRLRAHGLIQAYWRTNRILNSIKTYGNMVSFRDLEKETDDALALFGNTDARGIVLLKPYADDYGEYAAKVGEMLATYPLGTLIVGDAAQKAFVALFGSILRLRNILTSFDYFAGNEILSERQVQDYTSVYLDLYAEFRRAERAARSPSSTTSSSRSSSSSRSRSTSTTSSCSSRDRETRGTLEDREVRDATTRAVDSSPSLRTKKDLIEALVDACQRTATWIRNGGHTSPRARTPRSSRSSTRRVSSPTRLGPSSTWPSGTASCRRPAGP